MEKVTSFTDLVAWQQGHELVLLTYKITALFPKQEAYALTDQIRRSVVSITSNIAEGFSRRSSKEKMQFYSIALGSTTEYQNQLIIAKDLQYIAPQEFESIYSKSVRVHKLLFGLIKSAKKLNT